MNVSWRELGAIQRAAKLDGKWHVLIELGYPVEGLTKAYAAALENWMEDEIVLELKFRAPPSHALPGASNVIAVASGKVFWMRIFMGPVRESCWGFEKVSDQK